MTDEEHSDATEKRTRLKIVQVPTIQKPIKGSPGFAKKLLSTYALDLLALCGYGCRYCSSNAGNYLRINRASFASMAEQQLGEPLTPEAEPRLSYVWPDILPRLEEQLRRARPGFGRGHTLVFSMLTDGFSPHLVADGTTRRALDLVLAHSEFRVRILTKNACVGSREWIDFFSRHAGRFVVGLSIGTRDNAFAKAVEIGTSPPSARLRAHRRLQDAGVPTYGMLCPVFPDVLDHDGLEELLAEVRPALCEHVWAEPYNDRLNWRHVCAGYPSGTHGAQLLRQIYEDRRLDLWSGYATDLYSRLRAVAERDGWSDRLRYLLYEQLITDTDAGRLGDLEGVLLQGKPGPDGLSTNPHVAALERGNPQARAQVPLPKQGGTPDPARSAAARRAWETIRRRKAEREQGGHGKLDG